MQIVCDHHVPPKYLQAFGEESWLAAATVAEMLSADATDETIASFASANGWIVFTSDVDFYRVGPDHGLIVYSQLEDPSPGDVVEAIRRIDEAYVSNDEIREVVPGRWIDR